MDEAKIKDAEKKGWMDGVAAAVAALFRDKGSKDEEGGGGEVASLKKRIAELEVKLAAKSADDDDDDKKEKNKDKGKSKDNDPEKEKKKETGDAHVMDAATVSDLLSVAGIIAPGYKPTTDSLKSATDLKRDILFKAYTADAQKTGVAAIVENFTGKEPKFEALDAATIDAAFIGTGGMMKAVNNGVFSTAIAGAGRSANTSDAATSFQEKVKDMWK